MISFTAGASRFGRDLVYAAIPTSTSLQPFAGAPRIAGPRAPDTVRSCLCVILVACVKAHARTGEIVDCRAAASADTSHYSWPS